MQVQSVLIITEVMSTKCTYADTRMTSTVDLHTWETDTRGKSKKMGHLKNQYKSDFLSNLFCL